MALLRSVLMRRSKGVMGMMQRRHLPVCIVDTNLTDGELPDDFHTGLSDCIASTLNKPKETISVSVRTNERMCRNNKEDPTAVVQIWSIGVFDDKRNPGYTTHFFNYLTKTLKLPADRIQLNFHPLQPQNDGSFIQQEQQFLLNLP